MESKVNLAIQKPCSENFNEFRKTEVGGFCNSCKKDVIDFTKMNSTEIINYFETKNKATTCGRFYNHQLKDTYYTIPKRKLSFFSGLGLACLSLFTFNTVQAQKNGIKKEIKEEKKDIIVKGIIRETGLPLAGVSILLQGTIKGTETDFDGKFKFPQPLKKGDILVFSYLGYKTKKIVISDKKHAHNLALNLEIDLTLDDVILMGTIATKKVYRSKKKS
jgi:hypothetical protein